jgi:predicted phage-related endonuclease
VSKADATFINSPRFDALAAHVPEVSQDPAQRQGFIGGTDIQHVLGLEPYGCARRLWYQKTGAPPDREFRMTGPIVAGKLMEDGIAELVAEMRPGWKIRRKRATANGHELQRVDRAIVGQERGPGVLEIKTVSDRAYWDWKRDGVPPGYLMQVQWYMRVLGWSWACLAALNRDTGQLHLYEIEARPKLMAAVAEKVDWFMVHHVDQRTAPAWLEERDGRCESCQWEPTCQMDEWSAVSDQGLVQIDGLAKLMADYKRLKDLEKKVEASLTELRKGDPESEDESYRLGIEALMGVNAVADAGGGEYVKFSPQETQRIDTALFKTKYPEVYADVLTISVSRPLKVFKIKGAKA